MTLDAAADPPHKNKGTHDSNASSTKKLLVGFLSEFLKAPPLLILVTGQRLCGGICLRRHDTDAEY